MRRRILGALFFVLVGGPLPAQTKIDDPEVAKGIRLVDEGDYDGAIFTLDAAARRLAADRANASDLPQAYLYLGIAYVAKGHEAAAKAKFREALKRVGDLSLSPDRFPPKVIDAFEAARTEVDRSAVAPAPPPSIAPPKKGGGSKAALIVIGGLAAAGGGVALAAGGGGGSAASDGAGARKTEAFSGDLGFNENLSFPIDVARSGAFEAALTWTSPDAALAMDLNVPGSVVASSNRTGTTSASLQANVGAQRYVLQVVHRGDGCVPQAARTAAAPPCATAFSLTVVHP